MEPDSETGTADAFGPIDPRVDIGHVHLKVADIDRALAFYCGIFGFELQQRFRRSDPRDEAGLLQAVDGPRRRPDGVHGSQPRQRRTASAYALSSLSPPQTPSTLKSGSPISTPSARS